MEIILKNVLKDYCENNISKHIFSNINLVISQGSSYAIIGSSGIGKSTLLHLLAGIDTPTLGSIEIFDNKHKNVALKDRCSLIFQEHNLLPELSILENLMLPLLLRDIAWHDAETKVNNVLSELGMADISECFLHQLSGGQKQRAAVIRAVVQNTHFIFADEPSANLDHDNAQLVIDMLLRVKKEFGIGIVICSHDPQVYKRMDYIIKISNQNLILERNC